MEKQSTDSVFGPHVPGTLYQWTRLATRLIPTLVVVVWPLPSTAETVPQSSEQNAALFVRRIDRLFRDKCNGCHGDRPDEIEGGLDLRSMESLIDGGDSGVSGVIAGHSRHSPIYLAAERLEDEYSAMPPKESEALTEEELGWLADWIDGGATWPDAEAAVGIRERYAELWDSEDGVVVPTSGGLDDAWTQRRYDPDGLWAYDPLQKFAVWSDRWIDDEVLAKLPDGLSVAPPADRVTLIRRATYDLTGLPPTVDDVQSFVDDPRDDNAAFADVVDRLLASPHYGERMAQHWLDVTRYADSSGFANDYERGNAWRYRDWVVRAFNDDLPFDQFARLQIAGDEIAPDDPAAIIAAGFLRMGPWELTGMEVAKVARQRFLDDVTNAVGETFLGQSLQCCRCHDHKFDPIPTRDYYSVQACFATTQLAERNAEFLPSENVDGFGEVTYLEQKRDEHVRMQHRLNDVMIRNAAKWYEQQGLDPTEWLEAVQTTIGDDYPIGKFVWARDIMRRSGLEQDQYPPKEVGMTPTEIGLARIAYKGLERLRWEWDRYKPFALSVYSGHTPKMKAVYSPLRMPDDPLAEGELESSAILSGGDPFSASQPVRPAALSLVTTLSPRVTDDVVGRRTELANWITQPANPLTPRVIANRVWQWHFGRGLAVNPNNFGSTGGRPTHPELLDRLARHLIDENWSIKSLHRSIMNSDVYRRSSSHPNLSDMDRLDPTRSSLAVFEPRRLSAEELRDSMLLHSGELNHTRGGIPCRPIINDEVALQPRMVMGTFASAWVPHPKPSQRNRRSIYVLKLRGLMDPSLEVFNSPSPDFSCERRDASNVTPQVFAMFNSGSVHARALALAADVAPLDDDAVVTRLYRRVFSRTPSPTEQAACLDHWRCAETLLPQRLDAPQPRPRQVLRRAIDENTGEPFEFTETMYAIDDFEPDLTPDQVPRRVAALADLCLVLLNSNEFAYVY